MKTKLRSGLNRWKISRRCQQSLLAALCAVCVLVVQPAAFGATRGGDPSFFNSLEVRSDNLKPFKKWTSAVARFTKEVALAKKGTCSKKEMNVCNYKEWGKFLKTLRKKPKMEQVKAVNVFMNRAKYITDPVNWGKKDYWETPGEFLTKFGDCEDYAISKFMSLRLLGFKDKDMRVVAVKDLNLKVGHAVLVVYVDGVSYLLDNQIKQVIETKKVRHYQPVFSINTKAWWRHRV